MTKTCHIIGFFPSYFLGLKACKNNPCGRNAVCQDSPNGAYRCICQEGYTGDPFRGCVGKNHFHVYIHNLNLMTSLSANDNNVTKTSEAIYSNYSIKKLPWNDDD